jgi:hypothetical protein
MKARELAEILMKNPEAELVFSMDLGEEDVREYGTEVVEVMEHRTGPGEVFELLVCIQGEDG